MIQVREVMKEHIEFCNPETRVPDIKYIIKKYNYDEVVIVDSERHPLGIVKAEAVADEAIEHVLHPFDLKASELMVRLSATVRSVVSVEECLKLMKANNMPIIPVVDKNGHCLGLVKQSDLIIITHNYV
jgi:CBS domain-containing protein